MITVKSYPDNILDLSIPVDPTNDSNEIISNLFVVVSEALPDTSIEITYNGETITLIIEEECKYTPVDVAYLNKDGQTQILTFFKKRTDKLTLTNEKFERNDARQYNRFNTQGKRLFSVNSGYINEENNQTFEELLLSNTVWVYEDGEFIPVNVLNTSFDFKTRQNDRLISYQIDFEYAFNEIKNI